jgi:hypothetical protein
LVAAAVTFIEFWFGLSFIPKILLYRCFAATAFGPSKLLDGTTRFFMAEKKNDSVTDKI